MALSMLALKETSATLIKCKNWSKVAFLNLLRTCNSSSTSWMNDSCSSQWSLTLRPTWPSALLNYNAMQFMQWYTFICLLDKVVGSIKLFLMIWVRNTTISPGRRTVKLYCFLVPKILKCFSLCQTLSCWHVKYLGCIHSMLKAFQFFSATCGDH